MTFASLFFNELSLILRKYLREVAVHSDLGSYYLCCSLVVTGHHNCFLDTESLKLLDCLCNTLLDRIVYQNNSYEFLIYSQV